MLKSWLNFLLHKKHQHFLPLALADLPKHRIFIYGEGIRRKRKLSLSMETQRLFLIVGLGNPGPAYVNHRHNVGFKMLEALAAHYGAPPLSASRSFSKTKDCIIEKVEVLFQEQHCRVFFMEPLTYMNASGPPVAKLAQFYKIPITHIFVFHDEMALPLGKIKVKWGGGHAGHNGLKSLDAHLGKNYARLRIGIGHPGNVAAVTKHVLSDFNPEEKAIIAHLTKSIVKHFNHLISVTLEGLTPDSAGPFMTAVSEDLKAPIKRFSCAPFPH